MFLAFTDVYYQVFFLLSVVSVFCYKGISHEIPLITWTVAQNNKKRRLLKLRICVVRVQNQRKSKDI